ncbi:sulfur oxidation c-type cytochrome SoxX [Iodidimonas sp. SYSU 1G8]|uniref:sulfur oxidation c-type cytochrome SoxX n=1 Tax=Iodidimonas sp. SYSU 1G8 TaxID=3133967 RepID=UPI0031FF0265
MRALGAVLLLGLSVAATGCGERELLDPDQVVGDAIPNSLTGLPGDPETGRAIFVARESGHCVLCHVVADLDAPFQGNVGPALSDVGARLTPGQIRLRIVDASRLNPDTVMPPYYRVHGLHQVSHGLEGKPVLSSQQIEDLVAFLATMDG